MIIRHYIKLRYSLLFYLIFFAISCGPQNHLKQKDKSNIDDFNQSMKSYETILASLNEITFSHPDSLLNLSDYLSELNVEKYKFLSSYTGGEMKNLEELNFVTNIIDEDNTIYSSSKYLQDNSNIEFIQAATSSTDRAVQIACINTIIYKWKEIYSSDVNITAIYSSGKPNKNITPDQYSKVHSIINAIKIKYFDDVKFENVLSSQDSRVDYLKNIMQGELIKDDIELSKASYDFLRFLFQQLEKNVKEFK